MIYKMNEGYKEWVGEKQETYPDINMVKKYYKTNDPVILDEILRRFQKMIIKVIEGKEKLRKDNPRVDVEDLIQELNWAIIDNLNRRVYKARKNGVQPSTFFYRVCNSRMLMYLEKNSDSIYTHKTLADIKKENIIREHGASDKILKKFGIKKKEINRWIPKNIKSFTDYVSEDSKHTYEEVIKDSSLTAEQIMCYKERERIVDKALRKNLSKEEYKVTRNYMDQNSSKKISKPLRVKISGIKDLKSMLE